MMKNCTMCEYCQLESGSPGYSEYTPGWDGSLSCSKGKWDVDFMEDDSASFRKKMQTANACEEYKAVEVIAMWKSGDR